MAGRGETATGRVMVTLGIRTANGGYKAIPGVIVDTGAPTTYLAQSALNGTAASPGAVSSMVFDLLAGHPAISGQFYTATLAVEDGGQWASLGRSQVFGMNDQQVAQNGIFDGIGLDALQHVKLSYQGTGWSMLFQC